MPVTYDKYYETDNLFGDPYPELLEFFASYPKEAKILDLGCGQGRDAIALARLGFDVTGVDISSVGIAQMNQIANAEHIKLNGLVADIFEFDMLSTYDFVLFDSMFHFTKKDRVKETKFIQRLVSSVKKGCLLVFCIQDTGNKVKSLNAALDFDEPLSRIVDNCFKYVFHDRETSHRSESDYRLIVVRK